MAQTYVAANATDGQQPSLHGKLGEHELHLGERGVVLAHCKPGVGTLGYPSAAVNAGITWNRSPTRP